MADEPIKQEAIEQVPPQIVHGISLFLMDDGQPRVDITGEPTHLECQMLLSTALANVEGDIVAHKVVKLLEAESQKRQALMAAQQSRIVTAK